MCAALLGAGPTQVARAATDMPILEAEGPDRATSGSPEVELELPAAAAQQRPDPAATAGSARYALEIDAPEALREQIRRQTLIGKWRDRPEYDRDQFEALFANLRPEIEAICRAEGYFSCDIDVDGNPERVTVKVAPGAQARIRKADIQLTGPIEQQGELRRQLLQWWPLGQGADYQAAQWETSKRQLVAVLHQNGYLRAKITDSQARVDVREAAVDLLVRVESGPPIHFGELQIQGLERYSKGLVASLRPFGDGDIYNYERLQQFQSNLSDSGYFRSAYVTPETGVLERDPEATSIPLKIEVREEQVYRSTYGIGYGTDAGARLILGLEDRSFLGLGHRMDSGLILEQRRQRAFFGVRTPADAGGHYWAYGARYDRQDVSGERTGTTTFYGGRGKRTGRIDTFTSLSMVRETQAVDLGDGQYLRDRAKALVLGYTWNYRDLDSRIDPRAGLSFSSQISGAYRGLATDTSFVRLYTRTLYFLPVNREKPNSAGVFVGSLEFGQVFASTSSGIPSPNLFRAGGAQSLRGYGYNSIGVRVGNAVVGGQVLGIGSIEYQHPLHDAIWGAVFYDIGGAAQSWGRYRAYQGYGVGLRVRTPVGPVNLDAAYGDADRRLRLQFSVGFLF